MNAQRGQLLELLKSSDWRVSSSAARMLGRIGDEEAINPLLEVLNRGFTSALEYDPANRDDDLAEQTRIEAARALGELAITDNSAQRENTIGGIVITLELFLDLDPNWQVREAAAGALGHIGDKRAIKRLIKALGDPNEKVAHEAAFALYQLGDEATFSHLQQTLYEGDAGGDGENNTQVREWAEYVLTLAQTEQHKRSYFPTLS